MLLSFGGGVFDSDSDLVATSEAHLLPPVFLIPFALLMQRRPENPVTRGYSTFRGIPDDRPSRNNTNALHLAQLVRQHLVRGIGNQFSAARTVS
jgi:hypothetical protein